MERGKALKRGWFCLQTLIGVDSKGAKVEGLRKLSFTLLRALSWKYEVLEIISLSFQKTYFLLYVEKKFDIHNTFSKNTVT